MGIFQGKTSRYLIFTAGVYIALNVLASSAPRDAAQVPRDTKPGLERNVEPQKDKSPNIKGLEDTIEQRRIKQSPEVPSDKYGPQWQEEIRKNYRTELV